MTCILQLFHYCDWNKNIGIEHFQKEVLNFDVFYLNATRDIAILNIWEDHSLISLIVHGLSVMMSF